MRADERLPRGRGLTLRSWGEAVALQDIAHGLVTDRVLEVGQGADDPVVTPGAILLGHAHHQRLERWINGGAPWGLTPLGSVPLLRHQFAVPPKNRLGLDDRSHLLQRLLPQ